MTTLKEAAIDMKNVSVQKVKEAIAKIQEVLSAIGESISKATGAAKDKLVELKTSLETNLKSISDSLGEKYNEAKATVSAKVDQVADAAKSKMEAGADRALKNRIEGYREMVSSAKGNPSDIDNINRLIDNLAKAKDSPSLLTQLNMSKQQINGEIYSLRAKANRMEKALPAPAQAVPVSAPKLATA